MAELQTTLPSFYFVYYAVSVFQDYAHNVSYQVVEWVGFTGSRGLRVGGIASGRSLQVGGVMSRRG